MAKRALIVDDSKTAQVRLRKMLERFDITIDISGSAEEALGYLSYRQPDVIFLDHHMEGMSGLSALKIIKSNPATALIPVVMYTSEQGDVYLGQARALGALDIISKEVNQISSIEKVLASLGINPISEATLSKSSQPSEEASINTTSYGHRSSLEQWGDDEGNKPQSEKSSSELNSVQTQIGKLFEIHIAKVRQEIEDNTKFLMRRLSKEIQDRPVSKIGTPLNPPSFSNNDDAIVNDDFVLSNKLVKALWPVKTLLLLLVIILATVSYFIWISINLQDESQNIIKDLVQSVEQQRLDISVLYSNAVDQQNLVQGGADGRVLLDALSWAVNANPTVPFGEKALSDQRIYMLGELLALLKAANFAGTIFIDIHLGNYCVVKSPSGEWMLPEPESNLDDCVYLADRDLNVSLNYQVSVGFLNYLHSTPILTDGSISVELANLGYDSPKFSYPPTTSAVSAGQWNLAAAQNSRIAFSFSPD